MPRRSAVARQREQGVESVDKALAILLCFSQERPEWGVTQLAACLGIHKSRVYRALKALERRGFVSQDRASERYRLGPRLYQLGCVAARQFDILRHAQPYLRELQDAFGGTVVLLTRDDDEMLVLEALESPAMLRVALRAGDRVHFSFGAAGLVLAAHLPPTDLDGLIDRQGLPAFTPRARTDPVAFKTALAGVRLQGYAFSDEESAPGVRSVAAPVWDAADALAGIVASCHPSASLGPERLPDLAAAVLAAAGAISARLGHAGRTAPPVRRVRADGRGEYAVAPR